MKVSDIISASRPEWMPPANSNTDVSISLLMPTFRRGRDGLFLKAANSILSQSFCDLELIIVDDASTDGTSGLIENLMKEDGRVSCIRHHTNIGLPAISEFEAFDRARGRVIGFAFDDFVFEPDSVGQLLALMSLRRVQAIHGRGMMMADGTDHILGDEQVGHDLLLYHNFIANGSVFVTKEAMETVGLYDPHIALSRLCDWDLWRRLRRRLSFDSASILVGREHGASRSDSLGHTYPMSFEAMHEFMGEFRDDGLKPAKFLNRDVLSVPANASYVLKRAILEMQAFFATKAWFPRHGKVQSGFSDLGLDSETKPRKVVSVVGHVNASTLLYWLAEVGGELDYLTLMDGSGTAAHDRLALLRSDLVVFVKDLFSVGTQKLISLCRSAGVPHVYFCDDNLPVLAQQEITWRDYTAVALKQQLSTFDGIVVPSEDLRRAFARMALHARIDCVQPVYLQSQVQKRLEEHRNSRTDGSLCIACFGGAGRARDLISKVVPALDRLPVRSCIITPEMPFPTPVWASMVEHRVVPVSDYFFRFLKVWRRLAPGVVVHPARNAGDLDFKSSNVVIISAYLGAVPVVTDEAVYKDLGPSVGVEKVDGSIEGWERAFRRLLQVDYRSEMLFRLERYCRDNFNGWKQTELLNKYCASYPDIGPQELERRYRASFRVNDASPDALVDVYDGLTLLYPMPITRQTSIKSFPQDVKELGHLDDVIGRRVRGWAFDGIDGSADLRLEVDGVTLGVFRASMFRNDLLRAGIGTGSHGFIVEVPFVFSDGREHEISVKFLASGNHLIASPIRVSL